MKRNSFAHYPDTWLFQQRQLLAPLTSAKAEARSQVRTADWPSPGRFFFSSAG